MSTTPIICFGQQPCGFFPKRFLVSKIQTARRLQAELGGEIVFFCHDSDHDPRETRTLLRHRTTNEPAQLNFAFENKLQRKFSPLFLKRIPSDWQGKTVLQLPNYVEHSLIDIFKKTSAANMADFCLEMYRGLGLLEGIRVVRSSDAALRRAACDVSEFFVDVSHENEIVRARFADGALTLHEGGGHFGGGAATAFYQGTNQPDAGFPAPLDALRGALHAIHCRVGQRAYLHTDEAPKSLCNSR